MNGRTAEGLVLEQVRPERFDECADFIFEHFFPRERLAIASGLDKKPFYGARDLYKNWMSQGVSLMLYDPSAGRVAGLSLNFLVRKNEVLVEHMDMPRENGVIWAFLDKLEEGYDVFQHTEASEGLELCFLCVRAEYCGCGLAGRLAEETIRLAVDRGLGFVKSNPTTEATFRVFRKLGFQLIRQMKLVDYSDGTEAAFPHAEPDDCVGIAVKYILK